MQLAQPMKPKHRKVGRPKLPTGTAKAKLVPVRLTPAELRAFQGAAKAGKQTLSGWMRAQLNAAVQG